MYTQAEEADLVSDLLYVLGVNVNPTDNILMDQDTDNPILFEGKNIKATRNINKPAYISTNDIKLDPINPRYTKLMSRIFGYYLDKQEEEGELPHALSFYFDEFVNEDDPQDRTFMLFVKFANGTTVSTPNRRSKALLYTEMIFLLDGSFPGINFEMFDVDPDAIVSY